MIKLCIYSISLLASYFADRLLKEKLTLSKVPGVTILIATINAIIIMSDIISINEMFKLMLLMVWMVYASYYDAMTQRVDRRIHPLILFTGLIGTSLQFIGIEAIAGLVLLPLPFLMASLLSLKFKHKKMIGDGDIFYIGVTGFAFGFSIGLYSMIIGMIAALINAIILKNKQNSFALIPYITLGYIIVITLLL